MPLIYCKWPKNDTVKVEYELNENIFFIIKDKFGILSFGLGKSHYKCGKSQLLNSIFLSSFSINNNNPFSHGTVDIDLDL